MEAIRNFRLDHLSHESIARLSQFDSNIHRDNKFFCDIFHFYIHKKSSYHSSTSKASSCFELIDFIIWGP